MKNLAVYHSLSALFVLLAIGALSCGRPPRAAASGADRPPVAPVRPVTDRYFGDLVTDPYRWMEDTTSAEFVQWMHEQDAFARRTLGAMPGHAEMTARVRELSLDAPVANHLQVTQSEFVYAERPVGAERFRVVVRPRQKSIGGERVVVDIEQEQAASLDWFVPSRDGRHVAYGVSTAGTESSVLRVVDTTTDKEVLVPVDRARFAEVSWLPDNTGFLFARVAEHSKGEPVTEAESRIRVYLRSLDGEEPDRPVFGFDVEGSPFVDSYDFPRCVVNATSDLALGVTDRGVADAAQIAVKSRSDLRDTTKPWKPIVRKDAGVLSFGLHDRDIYAVSYQGASRHKLVRYRVAPGGGHVEETVVLPERQAVLEEVLVAQDAVYVTALDEGASRLYAIPYEGGEAHEVPIPADSMITQVTANPELPGCTVRVETWTTSPTWLACTMAGGCEDTGVLRPSPVSFADVEVRHLQARSADGTQVPLTVLLRRGSRRDGRNPTTLLGYGSYGIAMTPNFAAVRHAWFEHGGAMAIAHIRGGGERGRGWHEAGAGANKIHAIEDYLACAQALFDAKITSPQWLAAYSGSAGGIVVNGALVRRPDLFRAAFIDVGDANMLRHEMHPDGKSSTAEFGSVGTLAGYRALAEMDAYQHVADGRSYPAILYSTGMNDPRVPPWQPAKMAARLQAANGSGSPILLRVSFDAGHGVGASKEYLVQLRADFYSFVLWQLGRPVGDSVP